MNATAARLRRISLAQRKLDLFARLFWLWAVALVVILAIVQVKTILKESQTWDEGIHLAAGYSYLATGKYELNSEHPALGKILCALPLYLFLHPKLDTQSEAYKNQSLTAIGMDFVYRNEVSPDLLLFAGRSVTIALTLAFALWLAFWTRLRFGSGVALLALLLFTFDPNIIAHGRYITTDLIASLFVFVTCTLWIEYLIRPRWYMLIASGIAMGLAFSSKYSALFLAPALLGMFWLQYAWEWRRMRVRPYAARFVICTLVLVVCAVSVIVAVYWPEVMHQNDLGPLAPAITRAGVLGSPLGFLADRLHMPAFHFLIGLDRLSEHGFGGHMSYLMGQISEHGWWYYFPIAFLVKTPVGLLLGVVIGAIGFATEWRRTRAEAFVVAALALPAAMFAFFCLRSHIDIGLRHLLPLYAFLHVLIAYGLVRAGAVFGRWHIVAVALVATLVVFESLAIYPNYLAFFNFISGGPDAGGHYLLDSNLDWGQDARNLGQYMADHQISYVCLGFFGNVDVVRYGVNYRSIPEAKDLDGGKAMNCVAAISATPLYGLYVGPERYRFFRGLKPFAKIGYSIYLFDLRKKP
jgi:hypothetical protein